MLALPVRKVFYRNYVITALTEATDFIFNSFIGLLFNDLDCCFLHFCFEVSMTRLASSKSSTVSQNLFIKPLTRRYP